MVSGKIYGKVDELYMNHYGNMLKVIGVGSLDYGFVEKNSELIYLGPATLLYGGVAQPIQNPLNKRISALEKRLERTKIKSEKWVQ